MNQAVAMAIAEEMRSDPTVVLWGEDVAEAGGVFKATVDLYEEFGADRVRDTPISEMGFLGAAVGAASVGLRPVVEIMFIEFLGVALDQLVTEGALFNYLSQGEYPVPLTVRTSAGAGLGFGAQHSQTLERWFVGTPGLTTVMPSGPQSTYDLLRAAIRQDSPTLVIEPRALYNNRADVDTSAPPARLGEAKVLTEGAAATVVAMGATVDPALEAARQFDGDVEVIDLQTLWPWDTDRVLSSVSKTGRLVVVEESPRGGGWGAHIAAEAVSAVFGDLKAPVVRVTAPDVPVPFAKPLEDRFRPQSAEIALQVRSLINDGVALQPWWVREEVAR